MNISGNLSCVNTRPYAQQQKNNRQISFGTAISSSSPQKAGDCLKAATTTIKNLCSNFPDLKSRPTMQGILTALETSFNKIRN